MRASVRLQLLWFAVVAGAAAPEAPGLAVDAGVGAEADEGLGAEDAPAAGAVEWAEVADEAGAELALVLVVVVDDDANAAGRAIVELEAVVADARKERRYVQFFIQAQAIGGGDDAVIAFVAEIAVVLAEGVVDLADYGAQAVGGIETEPKAHWVKVQAQAARDGEQIEAGDVYWEVMRA